MIKKNIHCDWVLVFLATMLVNVLETVPNSAGGIDLS